MSPKFGNYLFRNLKGEAPEEARNPSGDLRPAVGALNEQMIVLHQNDIGAGDPAAPELDWSNVEQGKIVVPLRDTQGLMDGRITVKASTLQRICPELLPVGLDCEFLFPVSLKTVVLQVQANLNENFAEVVKPIEPDFDTPIGQVARQDEAFFEFEKLARSPITSAEERAQPQRMTAEPTLTPADRPAFPPIRNRSPAEDPKSEPQVAHDKLVVGTQSESFAPPGIQVERVNPAVGRRAEQHLRGIDMQRLQQIFMTEDLLDARQVAKLIAVLPRVTGALIMLADGTLLGGELPVGYHSESALLAPAVMRTVQRFSQQLKSCKSSAFTIFGDPLVSVFAEGNFYILVTHEGRGLLPGMRELLGETAKALDALYDVDPIPDSSSHSSSLIFQDQASGTE
ncbi:MAG: hypothetical protein JO251_19890 [Verrucomicrobia bacterium]|nr:hypothetical protein [Verrucomicrobiota bacterium]MBV8641821.1 hypothetical protein [Verrucomicrobiota bacterium]